MTSEFPAILSTIRTRSLQGGVLFSLLLGLGAWISPDRFFESYVLGFVFWIGVSLGCLGLLLLHHLVSGRWGHVVQRFLEAGSRCLPLMAVLFLPILAGMDHLYPWTHHTEVAGHGHVAAKQAYLNVPFFLLRSGIFFVFWIGVALLLTGWSRKQDTDRDPARTRQMRVVSAPGLVLFVLVGTFASVDWMMSLEPEWFSSIYALMVMAGQVLSALSFCVLMVRLLGQRQPFSAIQNTTHYHHLGNLLLAFTVFWAYLAFSQYLIIWSGNLPEENFWYVHRLNPGWSAVAVIVLIGHFFVPFLLLLSRRTKTAIRPLALIAGGILAMRLVDYFWLIKPAFSPDSFSFHWLDLAAPAAIGGWWLGFMAQQLVSAPLIPVGDPRFDGGELRAH